MTARVASPHLRGLREACKECLDLVGALAPGQYGKGVGNHSSIGAHMRHCLDHFLCFFRGLEAGAVNYDARERNPRLETDPECFQSVMAEILEELEALEGRDLSAPLTILQAPASGCEPLPLQSTIERELVFLSSHTIHHIAIMALVAELGKCQVPEGLGVAFSTAAYRKQLAGAKGA
ncbi:hypothetical protein HZA57_08150 [Candidatus Poribacteria bacterium]|nr:hypothetical protein [Candidatus Poribacteria bacterium]